MHTVVQRYTREFKMDAENRGQQILTSKNKLRPDGTPYVWALSDWDKVHRMREALKRHPVAEQLLRRTDEKLSEQTVLWTDTVAGTGLPCKARVDTYDPARKIPVDLKTTADASPEAFKRSIITFKYDIQASFYSDGVRATGRDVEGFIIVAIEKEPPYAIGIYMLKNDWMEAAQYDYIRLMKMYQDCNERNNWPAYPEKIVELSMPTNRKPLELMQL